MQPQTFLRWHRQGFRQYWTWKSRKQNPGGPFIDLEIRNLIRTMSRANPLWGDPRIHGELLKLDIHVLQATVSKYMIRHRNPPSQSWRIFLTNHASDLVAIDFLTVPTATFRVLYVFLVLSHKRRSVVHFAITDHLTAEWTAQPFRTTRLQAMCCGIEIKFMEGNFNKELMGWVLSRYARLRALRGRIRMWSD